MHLFDSSRPHTNGRPLLMGPAGPLGPVPRPAISLTETGYVIHFWLLTEFNLATEFTRAVSPSELLEFLAEFRVEPELALEQWFGYKGVVKKTPAPKPLAKIFSLEDLA